MWKLSFEFNYNFEETTIKEMMKKIVIPILALLVITVPIAFADDDYEDDDYDEERMGFGSMEREREREHQDDDELAIGSDIGNVILYATIGAIAASIGYTAFKVYKTRRPVISKK